MHFLVDSVEKRFPDVMDFASELLHVEKAARGRYICRDDHTKLGYVYLFIADVGVGWYLSP